MNITFVVGNGESRRTLNVEALREFGPVWGCNKIHTKWHVDNLVCVDQRQVEEAIMAGANEKCNLWTRRRWAPDYNNVHNINFIPDFREEGTLKWQKQWHWNSGPIGMFLACEQGADIVCMFGFDFYGIAGKSNNMYKGLPGYDAADHRATDPGFWIQQFVLLAQWYPDTQFVQVQPEGWEVPLMWKDVDNLSVDTPENFFQTLLSFNV